MCFTGKTLSVRVMRDERGNSRGFGFVNYENHEDAQKVETHLVQCPVSVLSTLVSLMFFYDDALPP